LAKPLRFNAAFKPQPITDLIFLALHPSDCSQIRLFCPVAAPPFPTQLVALVRGGYLDDQRRVSLEPNYLQSSDAPPFCVSSRLKNARNLGNIQCTFVMADLPSVHLLIDSFYCFFANGSSNVSGT
jgi:hypothetical protein